MKHLCACCNVGDMLKTLANALKTSDQMLVYQPYYYYILCLFLVLASRTYSSFFGIKKRCTLIHMFMHHVHTSVFFYANTTGQLGQGVAQKDNGDFDQPLWPEGKQVFSPCRFPPLECKVDGMPWETRKFRWMAHGCGPTF